MDIETEMTGKGILVIKLKGRMQLKDLQSIEVMFRKLIRSDRYAIVDLSGLEVLFSMGLRTLIMSAQTLDMKGGKMVLMAPTANVFAVLKASGATKLIPICQDLEEAEALVLVSSRA